jgi:hypothetical protein
MNSAITTPQTSAWRRIKTRHIAAVCGLALAATALAGGTALLLDGGSSTSDSAVPAARSAAQPFYPLVQEMSHPQIDASFDPVASSSPQEWSRFILPVVKAENLEIDTGLYPLVQEQSHPVIPAANVIEAATATGPFYPLVQEQSHPVVATEGIEAATATGPFYPLVQEQSHPVLPAAKEAPGTYPLVQEMSHPR